MRLLVTGALAGGLAGAIARVVRRPVPWHLAGLALVIAVWTADRIDGLDTWSASAAVAVAVVVSGAIGAARLITITVDRRLTSVVLWTSAVGVWMGVPETGPPILVGSVIGGMALVSWRRGLTPAAAAVSTLAIGWAAASGAVDRPWALVGGALCVGILCGLALPPSAVLARATRPGPWLIAVQAVFVVLAARWIGVAPNAGWWRVVVVVTLSVATGLLVRRS